MEEIIMCWMSRTLTKRIATEDIKVFKIGESHGGKFYGMYTGFKYQLNQLYSTHICIREVDYQDIFIGSHGFHSYDPFIVHLDIPENDIIQWAVYAGQRRLDFDTFDTDGTNYVKAECIIPKGSVYYKNDMGEIISNLIIIKNVEPIWN